MRDIGVTVLTKSTVDGIADRDGKTYVTVSGKELEADCILLCVGRSPELSCLGALADKLAMENGHVVADDFCRTSVDGVYACGDITNRSGLASSAIKMGEAAAGNAMGHPKPVDLSKVPNIIHTEPEAVSVGMSEAEAKEKYGTDLMIGKFPFSGNGMALAAGKTDGFVKVLAEKKYGEILGVHVLGGDAAEICDLMTAEITVYEAADIIHAHPTMSEALMEACGDALGRCIHLPKKRR